MPLVGLMQRETKGPCRTHHDFGGSPENMTKPLFLWVFKGIQQKTPKRNCFALAIRMRWPRSPPPPCEACQRLSAQREGCVWDVGVLWFGTRVLLGVASWETTCVVSLVSILGPENDNPFSRSVSSMESPSSSAQ